MKESTKQRKLDEKLAELLGLSLEEVQSKRRAHLSDGRAREAEAIGMFLEKPEGFFKRKCKNCGELFLTTYKFVSDCSTECRIDSLEKIGIAWNPTHLPDERWKRTQIPTEYTVPPKALKILIEIAKSQDYSNPKASPPLPVADNEPSSSVAPASNQPNAESLKSPSAELPRLTQVGSEVDEQLAALWLL